MGKPARPASAFAQRTVVPVLIAISASHMLNDIVQSLIPAIYPIVKEKFTLSFTQVGIITLCFQMTASILQPFVGRFTDKRPQPYSLMVGMCFTLAGILALWGAGSFTALLLSVMLVGVGSSIFHPEASRIAHAASGGKRGLAQSVFQLGGNFGSSMGPLLAALIVVPQRHRLARRHRGDPADRDLRAEAGGDLVQTQFSDPCTPPGQDGGTPWYPAQHR